LLMTRRSTCTVRLVEYHLPSANSKTVCISEVGHWMSANRLKLNADKTELLWVGSRHKLATFVGCAPSLQLGADVIRASDHVRLLGVIIALQRTLVSIGMSLLFARHASSGFAS